MTMMSAFLPTASEPRRACRPNTRAALLVTIWTRSLDESPPLQVVWSTVLAKRSSSSRFWLPPIDQSGPSATFIPLGARERDVGGLGQIRSRAVEKDVRARRPDE